MFTDAARAIGTLEALAMTEEKEVTVFGRRVRMLREAKKMSVRALARRAGISSSAVSQIEYGQRPYPRL